MYTNMITTLNMVLLTCQEMHFTRYRPIRDALNAQLNVFNKLLLHSVNYYYI